MGSFINAVTSSGARGQGFCDDSNKTLQINQNVTIGDGGWGLKFVQIGVTSFMGNPFVSYSLF
jgi:hypothetical protein